MSQSKFGELTFNDRQTIARWEKGQVPITPLSDLIIKAILFESIDEEKSVFSIPFTIQMIYDVGTETQKLTLGVDSGTSHIGASVVLNDGKNMFRKELKKDFQKEIESLHSEKIFFLNEKLKQMKKILLEIDISKINNTYDLQEIEEFKDFEQRNYLFIKNTFKKSI